MGFIKNTFWSFSGRLNRMAYFTRFFILVLIGPAIHYVLGMVFGYENIASNAKGFASTLTMLIEGVWGFLTSLATISLMTRRLHDLNHSGWWQLLFFIPFCTAVVACMFMFFGMAASSAGSGLMALGVSIIGIALIFFTLLFSLCFKLYVLFFKGTDGPNDYGPDPLKPDYVTPGVPVSEMQKVQETPAEPVKTEEVKPVVEESKPEETPAEPKPETEEKPVDGEKTE